MKITQNTNKKAHPMLRQNHFSITSYYAIKKLFKTVLRVMKNQTIGWILIQKIVKFQTREKQPSTPRPKNKTKNSKPYKTPKSETPQLP